MKIAPKTVLAASVIAITGSLGVVGSAAAAPAPQCPTGLGKVELSGDDAKVYTGLPEGTEVCIKAGKAITTVYVDGDGYITNDQIFNTNGQAKGISNYVWYTDTSYPS